MTESSGLPPEQEAVRRLLADARREGPVPPEVVTRLDDTLASLVAERASTGAAADESPGRVVDIGSRRRRVAGIGLLAAASVVVAGVALGQVLPRGADDAGESSAGSASDSSLADAPSSDDGGGGSSTEEGGDAGSGSDLLEPDPKESFLEPGLAGPTLFSDDDEDIIGQLLELRPDVTDGPQRLKSLAALRGCDGVEPGPSAAVVSAQVDGGTGLVVFRRPVGEFQGVELYVCGDPEPVRTLTLPAP